MSERGFAISIPIVVLAACLLPVMWVYGDFRLDREVVASAIGGRTVGAIESDVNRYEAVAPTLSPSIASQSVQGYQATILRVRKTLTIRNRRLVAIRFDPGYLVWRDTLPNGIALAIGAYVSVGREAVSPGVARSSGGNSGMVASRAVSGPRVGRSVFVVRAIERRPSIIQDNLGVPQLIDADVASGQFSFQPRAIVPVSDLPPFSAKWVIPILIVVNLGLIVLCLVLNQRRRKRPLEIDVNAVMAALPAIIYTVRVLSDGSFRWCFISRSAMKITGQSGEQFNQSDGLSILGDSDAFPSRSAFFQVVVRDGQANCEYKMRHGDGTWRWVRSSNVLVERNPDGSALVLGLVVDISSEHAANLKLKEFHKRISMEDYVSHITHELRQPLSTMAMAAENGARALSRKPPDIPYAREKFSRVESQVARVDSIIMGVRKLASYSTVFQLEAADLASIVTAAVASVLATQAGEKVNVYMDVPVDLPPVMCEPKILEQVFVNIIGNACDAYGCQADIADRSIHIDARPDGSDVRVTISDSAGGIPQELLSQIFTPFVTGAVAGRSGGIGLAIAQMGICQMGSQIIAKNDGDGVNFEFKLCTSLAPAPQPV